MSVFLCSVLVMWYGIAIRLNVTVHDMKVSFLLWFCWLSVEVLHAVFPVGWLQKLQLVVLFWRASAEWIYGIVEWSFDASPWRHIASLELSLKMLLWASAAKVGRDHVRSPMIPHWTQVRPLQGLMQVDLRVEKLWVSGPLRRRILLVLRPILFLHNFFLFNHSLFSRFRFFNNLFCLKFRKYR